MLRLSPGSQMICRKRSTFDRTSSASQGIGRASAYVALFLSTLFAGPARAADRVNFSREILPILSANCFACHGPDQKARKGKLRLDTQTDALRTNHPIFVPGKSSDSELIRRVTSTGRKQMPPANSNRKLTPQQIELLRRWIDQGAAWGAHWAYEAPKRSELPPVKDRAWPRNALDHFILARLELEGLQPAPEAAKDRLLRRVTLDLTGLPPTPEEVDAFLADSSPDAYEKVVDRLLASPHYGERMAWDWLDAARYADTSGYQGDPERTMWPWRDGIVEALNANQPFDQFTIEQLAGDLLPGATLSQKIATGFNRNHMHNGEGGRIAEETRVENVMDRVETTATVWMGATVGCARCHDHKFDPFTQREYYQLFAFFNNTSENGGSRGGQTPPVVEAAGAPELARLEMLRRRVQEVGGEVAALERSLFPVPPGKTAGDSEAAAKLPGDIRDDLKRSPQQRTSVRVRALISHFEKSDPGYGKLLAKLKQAIDQRDRFSTSLPRVMVMDELPKPRDTFILTRGAYDKPAEKVTPGIPACLPPLPADGPCNRLALARWLIDPAHPLTARVTVNRYWQTFFGTGLVKTAEDFGVQGAPPSHPELLDWLAAEFVRTGWDVKRMHRLLVTSATYRQSSRVTPALLERDPDNRLLARAPRFRLPSWMIRDQALAASGLLIGKLGGPSVKPYQPAGVWEEATFGKKSYQPDKGEGLYRRSLYTFWRRIVAPTSFFDTASRQTCTVKAVRTNTPLHALTTLNDITYVEAARALAQRVLEHGGSTPAQRIEAAFRLVTARQPTAQEQSILRRSLERLRALYAAAPEAAERLLKTGESPRNPKLDVREHAAYTALCSLILNLDETLTRQ
jgi:hypothetical protein